MVAGVTVAEVKIVVAKTVAVAVSVAVLVLVDVVVRMLVTVLVVVNEAIDDIRVQEEGRGKPEEKSPITTSNFINFLV